MASTIPDSLLYDIATGAVDCDSDTFYVMLLGSGYTPSKLHSKRSDLTANEISGTGYTAGGSVASVGVALDSVNHYLNIVLGGYTWPGTTLSGVKAAAWYKRRGGAASADELVAVVENASAVSTSAGPLQVNASTVRISNPS